ncbi:MAG: radical SAM family heme chaperone HemW [Candidatus Nitronauta litoralis]|uniref:Heme chaperone HemW n=1 Tax=Candidatus Nitronauta litoralis TaxID=2705533 RepID=A0A7T0G0T5_9BACT|nr:MAG: radical SAM family heme chaperone HemW [Candidatus Nitronauta litoralis]
MNPFGLYLHIPFCIHKCGYCDFNSHPLEGQDPQAYVNAIAREIETRAESLESSTTISSIFFGGGTPTTLEADQLLFLLETCKQHYQLSSDCEITLEANPGTIKPDFLPHVKNSGFNRISIGAQSFNPDELKLLERIHSGDEIDTTVHAAREAGFGNLSLDLMFALPDQSLETWQQNLNRALDLQPDHISCYNLMIEPNTSFKNLYDSGNLVMPEETHQLELFQYTIATLKDRGFNQYEISNFAHHGYECRHNRLYWLNGEHLGLGAGASSYINGVRSRNIKSPAKYTQSIITRNSATDFKEELSPQESMGESLMLGLRLKEGVNINSFEQRYATGLTSVFGDTLTKLLEKKLITLDNGHLALTEQGLYLADSVILEFISPPSSQETV